MHLFNIGWNTVTFFRLFSSFALSATLSISMAGAGIAQSLSDSSSALNSSRSSGYMGLGGNLGRAIERHHRDLARPHQVKAAKASRTAHHPTLRRERAQPISANEKTRSDAPVYLVAQSLDHSGLTINTLRLQHFP
jgi:hypothetical protein